MAGSPTHESGNPRRPAPPRHHPADPDPWPKHWPGPPPIRHLLGVGPRLLPAAHAADLLNLAAAIADDDHAGSPPPAGLLRDRAVFLLFFENSTRTRASFELAAKRLGANAIALDIDRSSVAKGESLRDTLQTIDAMGAHAVVLRHGWSGAARFTARSLRAAVVNAGSGTRSHPTQALLDALVLRRRVMPHVGLTGEPGRPFAGLRLAVVGDIARSRVARSLVELLLPLGAQLTLVGPPAFVPDRFAALGVHVAHSLEAGFDPPPHAVYALRVQHERQPVAGAPRREEYAARFCITERTLRNACPDALVMHPGPVNRNTDLADAVLDGPRSLVLEQVRAGVHLRMAVLAAILARRDPSSPIGN